MIVLLGALEEELSGLVEKLVITKEYTIGSCYIREACLAGTELVVARSGYGRERVETAVHNLRDRYEMDALISWGFAGSITSDLKSGGIVVCSEAHVLDNGEALRYYLEEPAPADQERLADAELQENLQIPMKTEPIACDAALVEIGLTAGSQSGFQCISGPTLTIGRILGNPKHKKYLGQRHPAIAVDMEAYWIGSFAQMHNVPFLSVRAISDGVRDWIPDLQQFVNESGAIETSEVVRYALARPNRLRALMRIGGTIRRASRNLVWFGMASLPKIGVELTERKRG